MEVKLPLDQNVGGRQLLVVGYWMLVGAALTLLLLDFAGLLKKGPCNCDDTDTADSLDRTIELRAQVPETNGSGRMADSHSGNPEHSEEVRSQFGPVGSASSEPGD